jgi:NitT/TauT family transport system substrate-binding protein
MAYFPNLTHSPALIGIEDGKFAKSLPQFEFSTRAVNAGPDAMEALAAGAIDVAYVGPCPALNSYFKSGGKSLKILAGVCEGGASLVCRGDIPMRSIADLTGRRVAVPGFGGTQDVSLRHFIKGFHLLPKESGGTVEIIPLKNSDILALFKQKQLDAAWVPEPWASRLVVEAGARVVVHESSLWPSGKFPTTLLVASSLFIAAHPQAVKILESDNQQIIVQMNDRPVWAMERANWALKKITGKPLAPAVINAAWKQLKFSWLEDEKGLQSFAYAAADAGYLNGQTLLTRTMWLHHPGVRYSRALATASR